MQIIRTAKVLIALTLGNYSFISINIKIDININDRFIINRMRKQKSGGTRWLTINKANDAYYKLSASDVNCNIKCVVQPRDKVLQRIGETVEAPIPTIIQPGILSKQRIYTNRKR